MVAQVIHGVGGSICAAANAEPRSAAELNTCGASHSIAWTEVTPSSGSAFGSGWGRAAVGPSHISEMDRVNASRSG